MKSFFLAWMMLGVSVAWADPSRQVIGGDLVFTAGAWGASQSEALFLAESQAVRMIAIECAIPHRETKIFSQSVSSIAGASRGFQATVAAGLSLEACAEGRSAAPERRKALSSPVLSASLEAYEQVLQGRDLATAASQPVALGRPQFQFSPKFLAQYERTLDSAVDCRERARLLLIRGTSSKCQW